MRIISPSLLSADFRNIENDIRIIENAGALRLHLDVMDGHFVPNLTFGPMIINSIRKTTERHLETHLMIEKPHESGDACIFSSFYSLAC
jgi:ribulose-phosphate 3-epimerase